MFMWTWKEWGFTQNPFEFSALGMDEVSEKLLVGRDQEIDRCLMKLAMTQSWLTVEGPLGVGKTSFIHVLLFRSFQNYLEATDTKPSDQGSRVHPLFIPTREHIEIGKTLDVSTFKQDLFKNVAQTLIDWACIIRPRRSNYPNTDSMNAWLNEETITDLTIDLKILKGRTAPNPAFDRDAFQSKIRAWVELIFPTPEHGGIVCILDNLESTGSIETATKHVESLRDVVMNATPGLRWILSGAEGVVRALARSDKLKGYLHREPIELAPLHSDFAPSLLKKRREHLSFPETDTYLPFRDKDFMLLHDLYRYARGELDAAATYCVWINEQLAISKDFGLPETDQDKEKRFMEWMFGLATREYNQIKGNIRERHWTLMDVLITWEQDLLSEDDASVIDDAPTMSEFEACGYTSSDKFEEDVALLVKLNLLRLDYAVTEGGRRLRLTPEARMVVRFKSVIADSSSDEVEDGDSDIDITSDTDGREELQDYRDKLLKELEQVNEQLRDL